MALWPQVEKHTRPVSNRFPRDHNNLQLTVLLQMSRRQISKTCIGTRFNTKDQSSICAYTESLLTCD